MQKSSLIRSTVFFGLTVVTVLLCYFFPNAATNPESGVVMWLPEKIEGFQGFLGDVSETEKKILPPDTSKLNMQYVRNGVNQDNFKQSDRISATLILQGADKRSLHRPEICLRAQGWTISASRVVPILTKGGMIEVRDLSLKMKIERPGEDSVIQRAHYVYWWAGKEFSTPHVWERAWSAFLNNVFKNINDRWAYPSVMTFVDEEAGEGADEDASKLAYNYIRLYAPDFMKILGAVDREDTVEIKIGN